MKRLSGVAALAIVLVRPAFAQPLGGFNERITTNNYNVDLTQGPVLGSVRVMGLAGAYVAIAEGVEGNAWNPAAPAVRAPWSFDHFDYDLGFGLTFPSSLSNSDFFNTGRRTDLLSGSQSDFVFLDVAANLQFGPWGLGGNIGLQQYGLDRSEEPAALQREHLLAQIAIAHVIVAHAFADHQLNIGVGTRSNRLTVVDEVSGNGLFETTGAGFEVGVLWRPNELPLRVGAAFRSEVTTDAVLVSDTRVLYPGSGDELYLPEEISLPWEVSAGVALQLGPRPFNPRWVDPDELLARLERYLEWRQRQRERRRSTALARTQAAGGDVQAAADALDAELEIEAALDEAHLQRAGKRVSAMLRQRYEKMSRFYVLISSEMLMTGAIEEGVGIESFLHRLVNRSGQSVTLSPRLGMESEVVPHWVKLRAGSYFEPTRFRSNPEAWRTHATLGFDAKLFGWSVFGLFDEHTEWRVSGALDVAERYLGWSLSAGVWH